MGITRILTRIDICERLAISIARAETVHKLPLFREAFATRRCLIPATGFYEWQQRDDGKQPYRFRRKDLEPFAFAGIWEFARLGGEEILSAAMIVGEPAPGRTSFGVVFVVVLTLFAMLPVRADVRIVSSPGGAVDAYLSAFARVRQSGERVIIDGPCLSACTLVLSTIPRNRICVTRRAVLGFHAPRWFYPRSGHTTRAPEATRTVTASYPPGVRAWIKKRGGLTQKVIYLRGRELAALYPRC